MYRDKQKQKEANLRAQRKRRGYDKGMTTPPSVTPLKDETVTPIDPDWQHVKDYILSECPGMPRLERLQRIAGSVGVMLWLSALLFGWLVALVVLLVLMALLCLWECLRG